MSRQRAVAAVIRDAELGDTEALAAVKTVGRWLGVGLSGIVKIVSPGQIVLGGFFARAYPPIRDIVEKELDRHVLPPPRAVEVRESSLGRNASLRGSCVLADSTSMPIRWEAA